MTQCTRFPVMVHMLVGLAVMRGELITSAMMAKSVATNPAVIRRLLQALVGAGWVETVPGAHGGARLIADPSKITLCEVFHLAEQDSPFALHEPEMRCPIAKSVKDQVVSVFEEAEQALDDLLGKKTIADLADGAAGEFEKFRRAGGLAGM